MIPAEFDYKAPATIDEALSAIAEAGDDGKVIADRIAVMQAGRIVQVGTPGELYHKPNSSFVADFIGHTNLLPGRVIPDDFPLSRALVPLVALPVEWHFYGRLPLRPGRELRG